MDKFEDPQACPWVKAVGVVQGVSVVAPYAGHHIGIGKPPKRVAVEIKCVGLFKVLRDGVLLLVLLTKWH